jgi:hypothetical protein
MMVNNMDIQQAVITLHDIARKVSKADGQLALDIRQCADRLNQKTNWLDEDDMDDIRRAT